MKLNYEETSAFKKDLKKLKKKFPTLDEDITTAKVNAIELNHIHNMDNHSIVQINNSQNSNKLQFYKIRKFACKSLKGSGVNSGIRITYAYFPIEKRITFLEIYFKANQANENKTRIQDFLKSL